MILKTNRLKIVKKLVQEIADKMNTELGKDCVLITVNDQYYNMKKVIEKDMTPVELAKEVMEDLDIKPVIEPIRGGTDGSKISFMGIPTQTCSLVGKTCTVALNLSVFKQWKKQWMSLLESFKNN